MQNRFERTDLNERPDIAGFIALGGGDERIIEAARLTRGYPRAKLVITGHGDAAARLAKASGLPADRIIIESKAQNTYENAQFTAQLVQPSASQDWILVTSALHMPRAMGSFRKASFSIAAWPVPDVTSGWRDRLSRAAHEWLGLIAYWLGGKTDSLFPADQPSQRNAAILAAKTYP